MIPSRFEEDQTVEQLADGLTTKDEAQYIANQADALGLGGGVAKIVIDKMMTAPVGDNLPRTLVLMNGMRVNAGVLQEALRQASPGQLTLIEEQYSGKGLVGPTGVSFTCTEADYHKARQIARDAGFVVQGGGTIGEGKLDIEGIGLGLDDFGSPQQGNKPENFVVVFEPINGSERPVCNAAFITYIFEAGGAKALGKFIASRAVEKGWRASAPFGGFVTGFGGVAA